MDPDWCVPEMRGVYHATGPLALRWMRSPLVSPTSDWSSDQEEEKKPSGFFDGESLIPNKPLMAVAGSLRTPGLRLKPVLPAFRSKECG